jgi:hypothetical protein
VNYVKGFNVLSIVVELPSSMLENGAPGKLGIWGTIQPITIALHSRTHTMTFATLVRGLGTRAFCAAAALALVAGCSDTTTTPTDPANMRSFDQVQRLGTRS